MEPVREALSALVPGITVMENLRFDPGEEANDPEFVRHLVEGFDYYVNDAFGACHRSHASIVGPPTLLPSAAGRLLQREVDALSRLLIDPARPFVAVVGGAKVSDKLGVLRSLRDRVDHLLLGGAMCFTFLARARTRIGASHLDPEFLEEARSLLGLTLRACSSRATSWAFLRAGSSESARHRPAMPATSESICLPVGRESTSVPPPVHSFAETIGRAGTLLWNGPMGVFEDHRFAGAPEPSPKRSPRARGSPSSAAARPPRRSTSSAWKTASITSPRAGAPHSSCSRREIFPVSPLFVRASPSDAARDPSPNQRATRDLWP